MQIKIKIYTSVLLMLLASCEVKERNVKIGRYDNNNIKSIKRYNDNNILFGEAIWFYHNGNLEQKVVFKNGKENGHAYYFYPSGALKSHRFWINGKMTGYCADYWDDTVGMIKASLLYNDHGELIYKKSFDKTGKIVNVEGQQ